MSTLYTLSLIHILTSSDNLKLHAYEVKNENKTDKWAIVVHGYTSEGKLLSSKAKHLYNMGYNVLVPDLRSHGTSEGNYIGMGWHDRLDIIGWINYIAVSYTHLTFTFYIFLKVFYTFIISIRVNFISIFIYSYIF